MREAEARQEDSVQSDRQREEGGLAGSSVWAVLEPVSPFEPVDPARTWPCHLACAGSGGARCERSGLFVGWEQEEVEEAL